MLIVKSKTKIIKATPFVLPLYINLKPRLSKKKALELLYYFYFKSLSRLKVASAQNSPHPV